MEDLNIVNNQNGYELREDISSGNRKMSKEMDENIPPSVRHVMKSVFNELKTKFHNSTNDLSIQSEEQEENMSFAEEYELRAFANELVKSERNSIATLNQFETGSNQNDFKPEKNNILVEEIENEENFFDNVEDLTYFESKILSPFQLQDISNNIECLQDTDTESNNETCNYVVKSHNKECFEESDSTSSSFDYVFPFNIKYLYEPNEVQSKINYVEEKSTSKLQMEIKSIENYSINSNNNFVETEPRNIENDNNTLISINSPEDILYDLSIIFAEIEEITHSFNINECVYHNSVEEHKFSGTNSADDKVFNLSFLFLETNSEQISVDNKNLSNRNDLSNFENESNLCALILSTTIPESSNLSDVEDAVEALEIDEEYLSTSVLEDFNNANYGRNLELESAIEAVEEVKKEDTHINNGILKKKSYEVCSDSVNILPEDSEKDSCCNVSGKHRFLSISMPNINDNNFENNVDLNKSKTVEYQKKATSNSDPNINETIKNITENRFHSIELPFTKFLTPVVFTSLETLKSAKKSSSNGSIMTTLTDNSKLSVKYLKKYITEDFILETSSLKMNKMSKLDSNCKSSSDNDMLYRFENPHYNILDKTRKISCDWNKLSVANSGKSKTFKTENSAINKEVYIRNYSFIPQASEECVFEFKSIQSSEDSNNRNSMVKDNINDCEIVEGTLNVINMQLDNEDNELNMHIKSEFHLPDTLIRKKQYNDTDIKTLSLTDSRHSSEKDDTKFERKNQDNTNSSFEYLPKYDKIITEQPRSVTNQMPSNKYKNGEDFKSKFNTYFCCCKKNFKQ